MPTHLDAKRDAALAFFKSLERTLLADEVMTDKQCVRMILAKGADEASEQHRRFNRDAAFRRLVYGKIDDALIAWCGKREIRADPFMCFRYGGEERGPTQHETALGLAKPAIERSFERLREAVPVLPDCSAVFKAPTKAPAPDFRLQLPLPFGAVGEVVYGGDRAELARSVYRVAMYTATGGDVSRGWRYDCGLLIYYAVERLRAALGDELWETWPEVQKSVWESARVWPLAL
jgi:hypothetical protein